MSDSIQTATREDHTQMHQAARPMSYIKECGICAARRDWLQARRRIAAMEAIQIREKNMRSMIAYLHIRAIDLMDEKTELESRIEDLETEVHGFRIDNESLRQSNEKYKLRQIGLTVGIIVLAALLGAACLYIAIGSVS